MTKFRNKCRRTGKLLLLNSIMLLSFASYSLAIGHSGHPRCESYLTRPNILDDTLVPSKAHRSLPQPWDKLKPAHLEAVAQILEMYPDQEIYFLARDAELLYDYAKLVTRNEPEISKRLHLLNISRANMKDSHVSDYLEQEGISPTTLRAGKQVLFVDTGFSGTIPSVIAESLPADLGGHLKTHLICSANEKHPSTRVFLQHINPAAVDSNPSGFHGTIISYEYLPRYTDRSNRFDLLNQKWVPVSCVNRESDGTVSKEKALFYMEDLKEYAQRPESQALMQRLRSRWKRLMKLLEQGAKSEEIKTELESLLANKEEPGEALVRDFLEIIKRNHAEKAKKLALDPTKLGLKQPLAFNSAGNKLELIENYPQWKEILQEPQLGIEFLIRSGDFQTLRSILDVNTDYEVLSLAIDALSLEKYHKDPRTDEEIRRTIQGIMEKGDESALILVASNVFRKPYASLWKEDLKELITQLEPLDRHLSSSLLADHDYPWGDPPHALGKEAVKYTRVTGQKQAQLIAHHGKSFKKAWKDPRGKIWGNLILQENGAALRMREKDAEAHCRSLGAVLPSREDFEMLHTDMKSDAYGYIPQFLPNLARHSYWTSSRPAKDPHRGWVFTSTGRFSRATRSTVKSVRCILHSH